MQTSIQENAGKARSRGKGYLVWCAVQVLPCIFRINGVHFTGIVNITSVVAHEHTTIYRGALRCVGGICIDVAGWWHSGTYLREALNEERSKIGKRHLGVWPVQSQLPEFSTTRGRWGEIEASLGCHQLFGQPGHFFNTDVQKNIVGNKNDPNDVNSSKSGSIR